MDSRMLALVLGVLLSIAAYGQPTPYGYESTVLLSGAVVLNDGSPPPAAVRIRRVCSGRVRNETWTDSQGHYSIKVDGSEGPSSTGDASASAGHPTELDRPIGNNSRLTNPVTSDLRDCEVQAALSGFVPASVAVVIHSTTDDPRLPSIVLKPMSRADSLTVSATTENAPKTALKAYDRGIAASKEQKWDAAGREYAKAVKDYPKFAVAWYELGVVKEKQGDLEGAAQAWTEAANADAGYLSPYEKLAPLADQKQDWADSAKYSAAWIRLDPDEFPAAYLLNAIANARLNHMDQAEASARAGLRIDKNRRMPRLCYVLGLILSEKHRYAEAVEQFQDYLKYAPNARDADVVRDQIPKLQAAARQ
jgi:tetratricopeptide (TPR) repeat protein